MAAVIAGRLPWSGSSDASPHETTLVALGDSVPAATACGCGGYVRDLAASIDTRDMPVSTRNLAVPGADTRSLLAQMRTTDVRAALAHADVVLLQIGANDVASEDLERTECLGSTTCWAADLTLLGQRLEDVLTTATNETRPGTIVRAIGYWNVAVDGSPAKQRGTTYVRNGRRLTAAVNHLLSSTATRHHVGYVDLSRVFLGDHRVEERLADDGDHPNAAGHRLIAAAVLNSLPERYRTHSG